jgi:glyoxylate reductase
LPRIFVTRQLPGNAIERLAEHAEVQVWPLMTPPSAAELMKAADGAIGLATMLPDRIDAAVLDAAPSVRIVSNLAVGYDNIEVSAATERGVVVTNTPGVLFEAVADLTFSLMLSGARRIVEGDRIVRAGEWPAWRPDFLLGKEMHGATLGLVGLGAIGEAVARRARGFGMRILYYSRTRKLAAEAELGVAFAPLDDLLRESDVVSIHVSLTPETRGLIAAGQFALMKPDALIVNTARGPIIDQAALIDWLRANPAATAALDVFESEPLPVDDPLLTLPNVTVAPHVGSATLVTRTRMANLVAENLIAYLNGELPPTALNPEAWSAPSP